MNDLGLMDLMHVTPIAFEVYTDPACAAMLAAKRALTCSSLGWLLALEADSCSGDSL